MDVDLIGIRLILHRCGFYDGIEDRLLARKVIIQRRRFNADCFCNLAYADGIVPLCGKQLQRPIQNSLLGILLFHIRTSLTNIR